jgi:hypothetical protein
MLVSASLGLSGIVSSDGLGLGNHVWNDPEPKPLFVFFREPGGFPGRGRPSEPWSFEDVLEFGPPLLFLFTRTAT